MQWIRTGRQLGQAVKNVQRLRQILGVFGRHGFDDIVHRMDLGKYLPGSSPVDPSIKEKTTPVRLRESFEELGPTFVKLGQVLSSRPDLLPEAYIEEFTKLQDHVQTIPVSEIRTVITSELGKDPNEIFASFSEKPLASASIAQVHEAVLKTGEHVVVKVQRPGIEKTIENDISLLSFLARLLERYVPESRMIQPQVFVEEFFRTLEFEIDFIIEANNIKKMSENMASIEEIVLPKVYRAYSTRRVLTLEKFQGIKVNDIAAIEAAGIDKKKIVDVGARAFFKQIMVDGLFHSDLHGGNIFVLQGSRIGLVDFGMVGRLSQRNRDQLINLVMALITEDFETLCYQYAELGTTAPSVDFDSFQREIRNAISPYIGLPIADVNTGRILIESTRIATRYKIQVPGDWMLVFRALLTIEGMGRSLDPDFDLMKIGNELVRDLVKNQYSVQRISKDFMWIAKDLTSLLQILPRQIRWMFRKFNSNDFAFEIKAPQLDALSKQLELNSKRSSISMICAALLIGGSITFSAPATNTLLGIPAISVTLFAAAFLLLLKSILGK